ncbi:MAG: PilZ domain-containing protein, partial [Alphaproteobacteria bacterium]
MFNFNQSQAATSKPHDEGAFQRVTVNLSGRLMLASHDEYDCVATEMSPGDVFLATTARP